jgi:hypothetical protein
MTQPRSAVRNAPASLASELRASVTKLAGEIGERNCYRPAGLEAAARWVERELAAAGLATRRVPVNVPADPFLQCGPTTVWNIEANKPGGARAREVLVVGAHYDSKVDTPQWFDNGPPRPDRRGTPGANDNATGVAALIALARRLSGVHLDRSIRFVAFVNEEPPFFQTDAMGSRCYARGCANDRFHTIAGMINLDTLGCYSAQGRAKRVPLAGLIGLPDRPDYVAFLSNWSSRRFRDECATIFRRHCSVAVRGAALPIFCRPLAWSDDWAFWQERIPAISVTDTAFQRSEHYHALTDTPDRLDYEPMAEVVWALGQVVAAVASPSGQAVPAPAARPSHRKTTAA